MLSKRIGSKRVAIKAYNEMIAQARKNSWFVASNRTVFPSSRVGYKLDNVSMKFIAL